MVARGLSFTDSMYTTQTPGIDFVLLFSWENIIQIQPAGGRTPPPAI